VNGHAVVLGVVEDAERNSPREIVVDSHDHPIFWQISRKRPYLSFSSTQPTDIATAKLLSRSSIADAPNLMNDFIIV
jgi:hypothetical protein